MDSNFNSQSSLIIWHNDDPIGMAISNLNKWVRSCEYGITNTALIFHDGSTGPALCDRLN